VTRGVGSSPVSGYPKNDDGQHHGTEQGTEKGDAYGGVRIHGSNPDGQKGQQEGGQHGKQNPFYLIDPVLAGLNMIQQGSSFLTRGCMSMQKQESVNTRMFARHLKAFYDSK
jgi:hypothetical protein